MMSLLKIPRLICALWLVLSLSTSVFSQTQSDSTPLSTYKFINGQWYDGKTFQRQTFYSVNGTFTKKSPRNIDETIDLANGFVIPPFAEAHNHNVGGGMRLSLDFARQMIQRYLAAGVFYVKIPGNLAANAEIMRKDFVNRPGSIDVAFANAVLTSRDGHPIGMTIASFKEANATPPTVEELEGTGLFSIEHETDLLTKWPRLLAGKPDFIKTILYHSESFAQRRATPSLFGFNGLNPEFLPRIVKQAHAAGLRVSTHVMSAADFATAVRAGVDEINHLPGLKFEDGTAASDYWITPEVAKLAASQNIVVVTTAVVSTFFAKDKALDPVKDVQRKNIRLLKQMGVRLAVGSDNYFSTSVEEAMYLNALNVFSNAELLNMWTVTAPQTIFPNRKIGYLQEGYEASFVVLRGNPLEDFERVKDIQLRFKQGALLKLAQ